MESIIGMNENCPSSNPVTKRLETKCASCPVGSCRVVDECVCPKYFLETYEYEKDLFEPSIYALPGRCAETHGGKMYPDSIEAGDHTWRGCGENVSVTDFGTKSCCSLTEGE